MITHMHSFLELALRHDEQAQTKLLWIWLVPNLNYCIATDSEAAQLLLMIVYDVYYATLADIVETDWNPDQRVFHGRAKLCNTQFTACQRPSIISCM
jgi:hypothetical protein